MLKWQSSIKELWAAATATGITTSTLESSNTAAATANATATGSIIITILITTLTTCLIYFIFHPAIISQREANHKNEYKDLVLEEDLNVSCQEKDQDQQQQKQKQQQYCLSLIIPAYNEELRLPPMLISTIQHLTSSKEDILNLCNDINALTSNDSGDMKSNSNNNQTLLPFEIIIVNDGSKDQTTSAVKEIIHKTYNTNTKNTNNNNNNNLKIDGISIRLLTLRKNCGKGAAVRVGMLQSKGQLCLMVDADDATNFQPSLLELLRQMKHMALDNVTTKNNDKDKDKGSSSNKKTNNNNNSNLIVFGSRAHLQNDSKAKRSFIRTILMISFHYFVQKLCSSKIHDTQCGFKLFTNHASQLLFHNLHLNRWAFDTELVIIAERCGICIKEVGVEWEEVDGSKLATSKFMLLKSSVEMLRDMFCVKVMYTFGLWRIQTNVLR